MNKRFCIPLSALACLAGAAAGCDGGATTQASAEVSWALVLPDQTELDSLSAQVWKSAAAEEGYGLKVVHDSDLLRPWAEWKNRHPVLIFPDGLHLDSPPLVLEKMRAQLEQGDTILIASDAFSRNLPSGALGSLCEAVSSDFAYRAARFGALSSPLELGEGGADLQSLIPPGAFSGPNQDGHRRWVGYQAPEKNVPHAVTTGKFPGKIQAVDQNGEAMIGTSACGPGKIVFANLPLTYLKSRTDGSLLHAMLKLVDQQASPSARLLPSPDGIGGIVFNIHVDSNAAIKPLELLDRQGFFSYGPFSVHVTAGPDARIPGDHLGFDVDSRPEGQRFLARLTAQGHAIGSHGGWIHDYFGKNLTDTPQEPYLTYLRLNMESLQKATGQPIVEYSAPLGNHPVWVTRWLEQHGVLAYYTTADVGLGPTRTYLDGHRIEDTAWSFPVNTLGTGASLEEFHKNRVSRPEVLEWLKQLSSFASSSHEIRLFYTHPSGIQDYASEMFEWLRYSQRLEVQRRFQWYRMGDLAKFLTRREKARWTEKEGPGETRVFEAVSNEPLKGLTWCLPKSAYLEPKTKALQATISQDERCWLVRGGDVKALQFVARRIAPPQLAAITNLSKSRAPQSSQAE